jgi:hypothetical protein
MLLQDCKFHNRIHKSTPLDTFLGYFTLFRTISVFCLRFILILFTHTRLIDPILRFSSETSVCISCVRMRVTCPAHPPFLYNRSDSVRRGVQILKFLVVFQEPGQLSGIALGYGLDNWGFESRQGLGIFLFTTAVQTGSGAHPVSYPVGTRGSFPGGKAAGV